jgi:hypothetical protein
MAKGWELLSIRSRGGNYTCDVVDLRGRTFRESLRYCAAQSRRRRWLNPQPEIAHVRELYSFLLARGVCV